MTTETVPAAALLPAESILSPAYRTTTIGMVVLVALLAFEALAVAAAMPTVATALDGLRLYALAFGGTLATRVVGMTAAGRWIDREGPDRPLWWGLGCFVLGLLLAGLATRMGMLVAGRLLQGLGSGAMPVALYVMVGRYYPEALRPRVFAAFSAGWVVPSMIGPALSGLIVQHLGWRWVFLAVPLLAIPAALMLRPALGQHRGETAAPPRMQRAATWCAGPPGPRWPRCCCTWAASSTACWHWPAWAWRWWPCCCAAASCCHLARCSWAVACPA
ncbi:MAG: putative multidrug-efflux transporter [Stenotrophomonas maltophilia]|nr:MAG: putative multidrug-efflux transporter [Stenotrophomonas maltophilia]